jgi:ribosomal protein S18 acetylase RimI-like enzyme
MAGRVRRPTPGDEVVPIRPAVSLRDIEAVRALFREYRTWLAEHREVTAFADSILETGLRYFDEEIQSLPGSYVPPDGALFVATREGLPVGCAALRRVGPDAGELKRLYVRPDGRGLGIGRRLTRIVLEQAVKLGYDRVVLDTLPTMAAAIALYREMGFRPIGAYWASPIPESLFFEYRLERALETE